ncbi:MAG: sugar phosphate isomerase/epimerase family protein [Planctomycetaceae bacterium]
MDASHIATPAAALSRDLRTSLRRARDLGIRGVELDARGGLHPEEVSRTGIRQIRKWLGDEGVEVAAIVFRTRGGYADADRLEGRITATKKALDLAHALGASVVLNHVGEIPPEADGPRWRLLVDVLADVGAWGLQAGATLCAEAGRAAPADLLRLTAALPDGALACDIVTGSLVVHGHDPITAVADLAAHVAAVHVTDAVAGAFAGRGRAVELGTGDVDVAGVLAALEERDYRGWIGIEPVEDRTAAGELRAALDYLRAL